MRIVILTANWQELPFLENQYGLGRRTPFWREGI